MSDAACNVSTAQTQNVSTAPHQPDVDLAEALRLDLGALEVKRTPFALLPDEFRHPVAVLQKVVEVVVAVDGSDPGFLRVLDLFRVRLVQPSMWSWIPKYTVTNFPRCLLKRIPSSAPSLIVLNSILFQLRFN